MTDQPLDPELAAFAEQLEAQRPRPSRGLRQRVHGVLNAALYQRILRRRSVWLVTSGVLVLAVAAAAAVTSPT